MRHVGEFAARYGSWAVVAGASDGVGAAFARRYAAAGISVVLVARRQLALEALAAELPGEARVVALDLAEPDAADRLVDATSDLEVGTLVYCAGADPNYEPFLDQPLATHLGMVQRNCVTPLALVHALAPAMVERGRGGIVVLSSGGGLVGGPNMVTYGATKAFDMVLGEALWAELHDAGVDVLSLVLGATDTPALRRLLAARGTLAGEHDGTPIPGLSTPEEVVDDAIAQLGRVPVWFCGEQAQMAATHLGAMPRAEAVKLMAQFASTGLMADNRGGSA